jgi:hypothetical protein
MNNTKKKTKSHISTADKNRLKKAFRQMEELSEEMLELYKHVAECSNKLLAIKWDVYEILGNIDE